MTNNSEILKQYKQKIELLKKHNKLYFNNDNPTISDSEYDDLKKEILNLEQKNKFLKNIYINKIVGSPPSNEFNKVKHLKPMLSLSNAFNKKDMDDFLSKIKNFLNYKDKNIELSSEPKIDGISATLIYEKGVLVKGLSRGDGITGEDILENLKTIKNIPKKIEFKNVPPLLEIRGEIYIGKNDFNKIKNKFANPEMLRVVHLDKKIQMKRLKFP